MLPPFGGVLACHGRVIEELFFRASDPLGMGTEPPYGH